jgi:hypothetical protein
VTTLGHLIFIRNKIMGKARDLARLSPNSSGQLPDANLLALAANKLSGVIPDANAPSGSVIQVVTSASNSDANSGGGNTWIDCPAQVTITPSSASSLIYIFYDGGNNYNAGGPDYFIRTLRNGTNITGGSGYSLVQNQSSARRYASHFDYDAPASTSALTYKCQMFWNGGSGTCKPNWDSDGFHRMIVMEVAG